MATPFLSKSPTCDNTPQALAVLVWYGDGKGENVMNALPVFHAALKVAGVSHEKKEFTQDDLEAARNVLIAVDRFLAEAMGDFPVGEFTFSMDGENT